jgi:hypothetical protein
MRAALRRVRDEQPVHTALVDLASRLVSARPVERLDAAEVVTALSRILPELEGAPAGGPSSITPAITGEEQSLVIVGSTPRRGRSSPRRAPSSWRSQRASRTRRSAGRS